MSTTEQNESLVTDYRDQWDIGEKLDFIAYHLRVQSNRLDLLDRKVESIGQMTTNVDAFCAETRAAVEAMRKNPLMSRMIPQAGMPPIPPRGLIT